VVARGIAQFTSLTSVTLTGKAVCDMVSGAFGAQELRHLSLDMVDPYGGDFDFFYDGRRLEEFFRTLQGLRELEFSLYGVPLPSTISCLQQLESLIVWYAPLANPFPETLGDLPSLKVLKLALDGCDDDFQAVAFPEFILRLTTLETLHLDGDFEAIPQQIEVLAGLRNLSIESNYATSLPESLSSLQSLETLVLRCPQSSPFPQHLHRLSNLTELELNCHSVQTLPPGLSGAGGSSPLYVFRSLCCGT